MTQNARDEREEGRNALLVEPDQDQGREDDHDALREIEDAGGLEDQDEAERDQRVEHTRDQALPEGLDQKIRRFAHEEEGFDEDLEEHVHHRALNAPRRDRRRSRAGRP